MQAAGSPAMASTCSASDCRVSRATATHPDVVLMASPTQHAGRHATMVAAPAAAVRTACQSAAVGASEWLWGPSASASAHGRSAASPMPLSS